MSDPNKLPLVWFAYQQYLKLGLNKNVHKTDWLEETKGILLYRLREEVGELSEIIFKGSPEEIIKECVDVANFAAMIAHQQKVLMDEELLSPKGDPR